MSKSIVLKDYTQIREEMIAEATITPGMLVEMTSAEKVQVHSSGGQNAVAMVALEDELQGNGIDDDYSADDPVQVWIPRRGDQAYMWLADGESVTKGDFLESDGNGHLQKHLSDLEALGSEFPSSDSVNKFYSNQIVAQALETIDLSDSSGVESSALQGHQRIKVRIV